LIDRSQSTIPTEIKGNWPNRELAKQGIGQTGHGPNRAWAKQGMGHW